MSGYEVEPVPPFAIGRTVDPTSEARSMEVPRSEVTTPFEYVRPVEKVVVAELNLEKETAVRQPNAEAEAVSQVKALLEFVRPLPNSELKELLPIFKKVVEAVRKEE